MSEITDDLRKRVNKIMRKDPTKSRIVALRMAARTIQKEREKINRDKVGKGKKK